MNRDLMRYYMRRLAGLTWDDIAQRARLRRFHKRHRRCLRTAKTDGALSCFFPEEQAAFRQLSTAAGVRAIGPMAAPGWLGDDAFWDEFRASYPSETVQLISQADAIRSGRVTLFGWKDIEAPPLISWSDVLDPEHPGLEWPKDHYAAIDFFCHPEFAHLDVKWCWELNRFQHLLPLAAAWRITRDESYARTARAHIESWIAQVQYPLGVQWSSNLEVALRVLTWARCHVMCAGSASWDDEFLLQFIPCLYAHVCHIERELTIHHTPGNHLLGEACSLIQICCLYPGLPRARQRLPRSIRIIERLLPKLILEDGVYAEQSTGYLKFVLEFLVSTLHAMDRAGAGFSTKIVKRLTAAAGYLCSLAPDLRGVPMIGDCDSGSAIGWRLTDFWDFSALIKAFWALTAESRPLRMAGPFPAESFLLAGKNAASGYVANPAAYENREAFLDAASRFHEFPVGGYQVSADPRLRLILDGGPLGIAPGYGHGHLDALSFIVTVDGHPFLVDPGAMRYNGAPIWRDYFRGASAHNTVRLEGAEPARPIAAFLWSNSVDACLGPSRSGDGWRLLQATQRSKAVAHTRSIIHWHERGILVGDEIQGKGSREVEWRLHFHPDWLVVQQAAGRFSAYHKGLAMDIYFYGFDAAEFRAYTGSLDPIAGWYSPAYGKLESCTSLKISVRTSFPLRTLISVHFPQRFLRIPPELAECFGDWENVPR
ncbi:MAG: alginate lyase family protein [Desulfomonilaceae bacterium]